MTILIVRVDSRYWSPSVHAYINSFCEFFFTTHPPRQGSPESKIIEPCYMVVFS
jgi:hypothetical protein